MENCPHFASINITKQILKLSTSQFKVIINKGVLDLKLHILR